MPVSTLSPTRLFQAAPSSISSTLGDEEVILDVNDGTYFGLNPVATDVWSLLKAGPATLESICDALAEEYDVDRSVLEQDVTAFVTDLANASLIEFVDA